MSTIVIELAVRLGSGDGAFRLELPRIAMARTLALFGPSGAGKTTTLDLVAGLLRPEVGTIRIGERVLFDHELGINLPPYTRRIGYVPQDLALFPHLNVRRNVLYGARSRGVEHPLEARLERVAKLLEIDSLLDRRVSALSGGERQRAALARALMTAPDLLLLDEPLASLDRGLRGRIMPYLEAIRDVIGTPLIYVSHSAEEVRRVAEWAIVLERGRVVGAGPPADVL